MEISRSELYRLVCEKPLSKVAPQFGISGTALSSLCKKHDVPYPGSGHWTRVSLGMPVLLPPLPPSDREIVKIPEPKLKRTALSSKAETAKANSKQADAPTAVTERLIVKQRLLKPHAIIAGWLDSHENKRREAQSGRNPYRIAPTPWTELDRRRHRLLDATFKELEMGGGSVSDVGNGVQCVTIDGEKIEFQIREKMRQSKVPVDDKQKHLYSRGHRTDLVGTRYLVFAIKTYLRGRHNEEYLETDRLPLEKQLPRIVERLFEGSKILKAWHLEREEERERWRQEAARRAELQRLAKEEEERWSRFVVMAQTWQTNQIVTQFIAELEMIPNDDDGAIGDKTVSEWLEWAKRRTTEHNPLGRGVVALFRKVDGRIGS